jgi:hypothetical protein
MPRPTHRSRLLLLWLAAFGYGCTQIAACPSPAGGPCDPRNFQCPRDYYCAQAEVCTRHCTQAEDCWVKVTDGCLSNILPGMSLPDGGVYVESSANGYCPETVVLVCLGGYCQRPVCLEDGGCDYDLYGPSPFKGNRSQGPTQ